MTRSAPETGMLSREQARSFYDRYGRRQDQQAFYEDAALAVLLEHCRFESATSVVELGCGTGRLARRLLAEHLPPAARYHGFDISATMVALAASRLATFGARAQVTRSDGSFDLPLPPASCDRVVCCYLIDLLPESEIRALVAEAHRLLRPGGLLCLAALSPGDRLRSRLVAAIWRLVHRLRPRLVGGCRPLALDGLLPVSRFTPRHHQQIVAWSIGSEVLVAESTLSSPATVGPESRIGTAS